MQIGDRSDTNDQTDLVCVYDALIGDRTCDPSRTAPPRPTPSRAVTGSRC